MKQRLGGTMDTCSASYTPSSRLTRLQSDDRGLSTVEYVIILVLIAATAVAAWKNFGETLHGKIKASNTKMEDL
jgi:Flp pilus assembly pilin Flp